MDIGCLILAIVSLALFCIAILESSVYRELEAGFFAIPAADGTARILPAKFRLRMIVLGAQGIMMAGVTWYLFRPRGKEQGGGVWLSDIVVGAGMFAICGAALMSYVLGCFLRWPAWIGACKLYVKEGPIDTFHAIAFTFVGIALGLAAFVNHRRADSSRTISILLIVMALGLLVAGMEEISWGQTFFGWQTPESVMAWNFQNETNLHNAFNNMLGQAYLAAGLCGFIVIAVSIAIRRKAPDHPVSAVLPTAPIYWGALWLPLASQTGVYTDTEPLESIVAILIVFYAVSLWRRKPFLRVHRAN
jgi:hypothetical protein